MTNRSIKASTNTEELEEFRELANRAPVNKKAGGRLDEPVTEAASDEEKKLPGDPSMWAVSGRTYRPCESAVDELVSAIYTIQVNPNIGIFFERQDMRYDDLMVLPDSASESVISSIEDFWNREQSFRDYGFLWKRGILLWGPPGGGKTCTVQLIARGMLKRDGIVVYVDNRPEIIIAGLRLMRQIEPDRLLVVVLEDLDAIIERYGEAALLSLLDGEMQIDNVVFIATTNYPELLDRRILNRPSRFDIVRKIGMPSPAARRVYLEAQNKRFRTGDHDAEIKRWVEETNGFSVAHLKELIVLVEVFGTPFEDAVEQLRAMIGAKPSSADDGDKPPVGFLPSSGDGACSSR